MNKYLQELLKLAKTVIIPGLGALTITNDKTGDIFFMSYLKHDDGKLAEFIASKEGIELIDAKNNLAKYVREITALLDKGESFDIFNFGKFKKNTSGDIVFEQATKIEYKLSESTYSIDVNEKIALELERVIEIDSEEQQIKEQPSLDTILNEKSGLEVGVKSIDKETSNIKSIKNETTEKQAHTNDEIDNVELKEDKPLTIELDKIEAVAKKVEQESISSTKDEVHINENNSTPSAEENFEDEIEITKTEKTTKTKKQKREQPTDNIETNIENGGSNTSILKESTENNIDKSMSELNNTSEQHLEQLIEDTTPPSPKKNANKKRIIGILIPMIIASFAFLYPKFFTSSNRAKEKASLVEHKEKQDNSQQLEDSSQNTPSEEVKVEETVQATNTVPQPVTPPITPAPVTTTKMQPAYQQPINTTIPKTNVTVQIHVIVGSFTQKENAMKFNQSLIQKGYSNGTIIENGGLILLSLGSFPTVQEAANFGRTLKLPTGYWLKATK